MKCSFITFIIKNKSKVLDTKIVKIKKEQEEHDYYERDGDDIYLEIPLTITEAVLGCKKTIPTILKKQSFLSEYYDLPYKYNKTVVKILAQTPTKLFIYWEISDEDRNSFVEKHGNDFFDITKPVLIIHNLTMNYSFEIDINDFANCWYVSINDADCLYSVELGRRPFNLYEKINEPYIYVSSSNNLQTPNNHILFENINSNTVFKIKNVKTNVIATRKIDTLSKLANIAKTYNNDFYNYYTKLYSKDLINELNDTKLNNPSSGAISSFK